MPTIREIYELFITLKSTIAPGDRACCFDQEEDSVDSFDVTISYNQHTRCWHYQTGDNSYTGACYGDRFWITTVLTRRSNCRDLARDVVNQLKERVSEYYIQEMTFAIVSQLKR